MDNLVDACTQVYMFWQSLASMSPLVGFVDQCNFDHTKGNVVVGVTNSQTFRDLQKSLDWVYMVAPGMAVICTTQRIEDLDTLDQFVATCVAYNRSKNKARVNTGATYAERIVLSKALMDDPQVAQKLTGPNNRVYYDRYESYRINMGDRMNIQEGRSLQAVDETEVVATLGNWTHVTDKADMVAKLQACIVPYMINQLKAKGWVNKENTKEEVILRFTHTHLPTVFKLKCMDSRIAEMVCLGIIDVPVSLKDCTGNINFSSNFHRLAKQDLTSYFSNLAIKDATDEYSNYTDYQEEQMGQGEHVGSSMDDQSEMDGWGLIKEEVTN
jgi:hypothetical protein